MNRTIQPTDYEIESVGDLVNLIEAITDFDNKCLEMLDKEAIRNDPELTSAYNQKQRFAQKLRTSLVDKLVNTLINEPKPALAN